MRIKKIHIDIEEVKEKLKVFVTPGGLFSVLYFTKALGIGPTAPSALILLAAMSILGWSFREKIEFHLNTWPLWALLIWIPVSIVVARPDPCFKSFQRYVLFLIVVLVISPAITNSFLEKVRRDAFDVFGKLSVVFTVGSFFAYFLGINYYIDVWGREGIEFYQNTAGQFGGFFCHTMILGPVAVVSAIIALVRFVCGRKWYWLVALICSAGSCAFSASRASFAGMLLSLFVVLLVMIKDRRQLVKVCVGASVLLLVSFPLWIGSLAMLQQKQATNNDQGSVVSSRSEKYLYRFLEIAEHPVFGVGFAAVDTEIGDGYIEETGTIEPGSSWLCIASMAGLPAFAFFLVLYVLGGRLKKKKILALRAVLSAILLFFGLHMLVEGYIFSIGNSLCYFVWLMIGFCYISKDCSNA